MFCMNEDEVCGPSSCSQITGLRSSAIPSEVAKYGPHRALYEVPKAEFWHSTLPRWYTGESCGIGQLNAGILVERLKSSPEQ